MLNYSSTKNSNLMPGILVGVIFFMTGIYLLFYFGGLVMSAVERNYSYVELTAKIASFESNKEGQKVIALEYVVMGHAYIKMINLNIDEELIVGTPVDIWYNPKNPAEVSLSRDTSISDLIIPGVVGMVFVVFGIYIIKKLFSKSYLKCEEEMLVVPEANGLFNLLYEGEFNLQFVQPRTNQFQSPGAFDINKNAGHS